MLFRSLTGADHFKKLYLNVNLRQEKIGRRVGGAGNL